MGGRRRTATVVSGMLALLGLVALPAAGLQPVLPAAHAAAGIELSLDGTHWSATLDRPVFPSDQVVVPGTTLDGTFFVRNATTSSAWIRVGVAQLTVTSLDLAVSMNLTTIGTTTDSASGSTSRLSAGDIVCNDVLVRPTPVPPGGIIRVDTALDFRADVTGTTAQNEAARVTFLAELSEVDLNALGQPLCTNSMVIGPVDPNAPAPPPTGSDSGDVPVGDAGSTGPGTETPSTGGGAGTPANGSGPIVIGAPATGSISGGAFSIGSSARPFAVGDADLPFNTVRWWEEYAILVLVVAALGGAIARWYAQRRWVDRDHKTGGML